MKTVRVPGRRFTMEEYHQMVQAGLLAGDDRVELIEGEIVEIAPISRRHAACVTRLIAHLAGVREKAIIWAQNPIRLGDHSEPQPDLALLRPRSSFYGNKPPGPGEVLLVVEVAEASQEYDLEVKIPLYARAGIPEAWLVDLTAEVVKIYHNPAAQGYKEIRKYQRGERLVSRALPDLELAVDEVFSCQRAGGSLKQPDPQTR